MHACAGGAAKEEKSFSPAEEVSYYIAVTDENCIFFCRGLRGRDAVRRLRASGAAGPAAAAAAGRRLWGLLLPLLQRIRGCSAVEVASEGLLYSLAVPALQRKKEQKGG